MNKKAPSLPQVSLAVSELMPNIIRGVQLDFFTTRPVTQTQFLVLVAIQATGRTAMTKLAGDMRIKMPTATGLVDRLVAAGYARRFSEPRDRRKVFVEITPKGARFFEEFRTVMRRRWEEVLQGLSLKDRRAFFEVVVKLRDRLKEGASRE